MRQIPPDDNANNRILESNQMILQYSERLQSGKQDLKVLQFEEKQKMAVQR